MVLELPKYSAGADEWEAYDRAKMAEQDARGALSLARREGHEEGRKEGREGGLEEGARTLRATLVAILEARGMEISSELAARIETATDFSRLQRWISRAAIADTIDEALGGSEES